MKKKRIILYFLIVIFSFLFNFYFRPIKGNPLITKEYKKSKAYVNSLYKSDEYFKKKLLDKDGYNIYEEMIKMSLSDSFKEKISCNSKCKEQMEDAYYSLLLDHPELISYEGMWLSYNSDDGDEIKISNYENLDKMKTYFGTKRIEREMENIRHDTKNMSDKEKIIYVYDYVASHNYDRLFTYIGSNQSAYSFFSKGSSVCAGFAKAAQIIFQNIGIKSYLVLGYEHMWNYVEYKGKYYVFDATVGASYKDKKASYYYDGLGRTTVEETIGMYKELYPKIENVKLKELFKIK